MPMKFFNRSSTFRQRLSVCTFSVGFACVLVSGIFADVKVDDLEYDTFSRITDMSDFPYFGEAYYFPIQSEGITTTTDEILILSNFGSLLDLITPDNDPDELDEYEVMNIAEYSSYQGSVVDRPEIGYFAFKFASDDVSIGSSGAVGFMRKSRRLDDLPSTKMEGLFVGAKALVEWDFLDFSNAMLVDLEYEIDGTQYVRSDDASYLALTGGLNFSSISFPVTEEIDSLLWSFSGVFLNHFGDGEFYGLASRSDFLDEEVLEGIIPEGVDPNSLWNRHYVMRFYSPHDRDRDHIPDIIDKTGSVSTYPWYADVETFNDWYWAHWLTLWIYSDRLSDWEYWQFFGWTFVSENSTRDDFWFHSPSISSGWLVSSDSTYPTVYDTLNEEYLYLVVVNDDMGYVYSYKTDTWRPVNP